MKSPFLIVFAGPNGSGKSTFYKYLSDLYPSVQYINADDIKASNINMTDMDAALEAERLRHYHLNNGDSFIMETVLSTPRNLDFMNIASARGYYIIVYYVLTHNSNVNVARVKRRVELGGHDVPTDKIISRYQRCIELLPKVIESADEAYVFNNSLDAPLLIIKKLSDCIQLYPYSEPSRWSEEMLIALIDAKTSSRIFIHPLLNSEHVTDEIGFDDGDKFAPSNNF